MEHVVRSSDYSCRRVIGGLLVVVLLALPGALLAEGAGWAGGVGDGNLRLTVTVNGRADSHLRPPEVRVGGWVVKRYRLLNLSEADLHRVRVLDPGAPAGSVRCPGSPLPAAGEVECVARFRAVAGRHVHPVRAEGDVPSLHTRLTATARSGYAGVAGALQLTEEVVVAMPGSGSGSGAGPGAGTGPGAGSGAGTGLGAGSGSGSGSGGASVTVTYTVTNRGNLPLQAVRVEDPGLALAPGAPDCGGQGGTVPVLAVGTSALCTATVRLAPGTYRSTGRASGSDRATTLGAGGERVSAPVITAGASAAFVVGGGVGAGAGAGAGAGSGSGGAAGSTGSSSGSRGAGAGAGASGASGSDGVPGAPGVSGASGAGGSSGVSGTSEAAGASQAAGAGSGAVPGALGALGAPGASGALAGAGTTGLPAPPAVPGAGVAPGAVPPGVVPPPPGAVPPVPTPVPPPDLRRAAGLDGEGFLGRVRRRAREAREFGVATMLLMLLIPAAVAAALLGSRRS
ncbi:hypothetical protein [Streptomyces sp. cmx-4-25]|uniref:hypothetical protein n=1 Tax=Streptomyces sp. cmx-4-25 TaxID=2790933 RepID=UPI00398001D0